MNWICAFSQEEHDALCGTCEEMRESLSALEGDLKSLAAARAKLGADRADLAGLEAGSFNPDELNAAQISKRMDAARASIATGAARIAQLERMADERAEQIWRARHAAVITIRGALPRMRQEAEGALNEALRPLFSAEVWAHDFHLKGMRRDLVARSAFTHLIEAKEYAAKYLLSRDRNPGDETAEALRRGAEAITSIVKILVNDEEFDPMSAD